MHRSSLLVGVLLLAIVLVLFPAAGGRTGRVVGPGGPITGARVRFQGGRALGRTDEEGRFRVAHPAGRITAWKEGFFIGGAMVGRSPLEIFMQPLPAVDDDRYRWVDPTPHPAEHGRCGNCHDATWGEWASGRHARSVSGGRFRDLYAGTDARGRPGVGWGLLPERPDGAGVCASCHAPTVADDDPALYDLRQVGGVAARGVHCDYCHKVAGLGSGEIGLTHGRFLLQLLRPAHGQLFFGPLDDVDRGEEACSPFLRDSRFCAPCHEGTLFGVAVYTTYSEWQRSPAARRGQSCQSCHMKPTGQMANFAPGAGGIDRDPRTLANHRFWDGSHLAMLRQALQLQTRAWRTADRVTVEVGLSAPGAGHRIPTGFIDRHLLLVVEARGPDGQPRASLTGPRLPTAAGKRLTGQPGRFYGRILHDQAGRAPVPFWRQGVEEEDTRLLPDQEDRSRFVFPATATVVQLRLIHRRFFADVTQEKGWPADDQLILDRRVVLDP